MPGILGRKIGMTRIMEEDGTMVPLTVVECTPNTITQVKTTEKDGYNAIVLGYHELNRPTKNKKYRHKKEFKVESIEGFNIGDQITVENLAEVEKVNFTSTTKGKGFQGVVKRFNFKTGPNSHGSKHHRNPGSIGSGTAPGRVMRGKKLAGHMGTETQTMKNVKLVLVDKSKNILGIKGPIPGGKNNLVAISY
jgi:large subunit ribosomal protein L3